MSLPLLLIGGAAVAFFLFSDDEKKKGTGGGTGSAPPGLADCLDETMPPNLKQATIEALQSDAIGPEALEALAQTASFAGYTKAAACLQAKADKLGGTGGTGTGGTPPFIPGGDDEGGDILTPPGPGPGDDRGTGTGTGSGLDDLIGKVEDLLGKQDIPGTEDLPGLNEGEGLHAIRFGDTPFFMAKYYTGNGVRFKELEPLNPHLGQLKTVNGVSNYPGWVPGALIKIPASWGYYETPLPVAGTQTPSGTIPTP